MTDKPNTLLRWVFDRRRLDDDIWQRWSYVRLRWPSGSSNNHWLWIGVFQRKLAAGLISEGFLAVGIDTHIDGR
ncbi:hypothetical protein GCM10011396_00680 [Undibacterium terreum]|uniref:Uncharacterized protein n=1 Tax=Undibacterium terreum TaxID=1224302 RepID=A0A916U392_9BURK|nr:hypothetical protein GCM10011396_00680 [Undibacterium terreum]